MFARILFTLIITFFASSSMASPVCVQKYERGTPQFDRCMAESRRGQSSLDIQMEMGRAASAIINDERLPKNLRDRVANSQGEYVPGLLAHCRKVAPNGVQACLDSNILERTAFLKRIHKDHLKANGH